MFGIPSGELRPILHALSNPAWTCSVFGQSVSRCLPETDHPYLSLGVRQLPTLPRRTRPFHLGLLQRFRLTPARRYWLTSRTRCVMIIFIPWVWWWSTIRQTSIAKLVDLVSTDIEHEDEIQPSGLHPVHTFVAFSHISTKSDFFLSSTLFDYFFLLCRRKNVEYAKTQMGVFYEKIPNAKRNPDWQTSAAIGYIRSNRIENELDRVSDDQRPSREKKVNVHRVFVAELVFDLVINWFPLWKTPLKSSIINQRTILKCDNNYYF